jgi:regulator of protease activity HflC (stomatin/prohibitin superfamily)
MKNLALVGLLALVLLGVNSIFVVSESHVGVLFQFGRIVRSDIAPRPALQAAAGAGCARLRSPHPHP